MCRAFQLACICIMTQTYQLYNVFKNTRPVLNNYHGLIAKCQTTRYALSSNLIGSQGITEDLGLIIELAASGIQQTAKYIVYSIFDLTEIEMLTCQSGQYQQKARPPLRIFVIFFIYPIKLGSKWHWLTRKKWFPLSHTSRKCDVGPKMCPICHFYPRYIASI